MFLISSIFVLGVAVISIIYGLILCRIVKKKPDGNKKIVDIARIIKDETTTFLRRQHLAGATVWALVLVLILYLLGWKMALGYLVGIVFAAIASFLSAVVSNQANSRAVEGLRVDLKKGFNVGFKASLASGLISAGLGLLAIGGFYLIFRDTESLIGLVLGTVLFSLFARLSGIIFAKNSDNAGMIADIFGLFSVSTLTLILVGSIVYKDFELATIFPLVIIAASTLLAVISSFFVFLWRKSTNIISSLYRGLALNGIFSAAAFYFIVRWLMKDNSVYSSLNLYFCVTAGLLIVYFAIIVSTYFSSKKLSIILSAIIIAGAIAGAYNLAGFYGLAVTGAGMISLLAMIVTLYNCGSIFGNVNLISKEIELTEETKDRVKLLDPVVNSLKASTKSVAFFTSSLIALTLFYYFCQRMTGLTNNISFDLKDPYILVGLILGGILPHYISASIIEARDRAKNAAEKASTIAFINSYLPVALCVLSPVLIGLVIGPNFLVGFLISQIVIGIYLSISDKDVAGSILPSVLTTSILVSILSATIMSKYSLTDTGKIIIIAVVVIAIAALIIFKPKNDK